MLDVATETEQCVRLHVWHHKVHVMHVAHMKATVVWGVLVAIVKAWMQCWAEAEGKPRVVGWRALRHATEYVTDQPLKGVW